MNGTILTLVSFDYESPDVLLAVDYVVTVTDGGSPVPLSSSTTLRLIVADLNDNAPVFTVDQYEFEVPENRSPGLQVGTVTAVDADEPPFDRVVYRLTTDAQGRFDVDRHSGVIVTAVELDREQVVRIMIHNDQHLQGNLHRRRRRGAPPPFTPPPKKKKSGKYFSGNYYVKFGHFRAKIM